MTYIPSKWNNIDKQLDVCITPTLQCANAPHGCALFKGKKRTKRFVIQVVVLIEHKAH